MAAQSESTLFSPEHLQQQIADLGDWFHNINLRGVWTAPQHFLGDYPNVKWKHLCSALPQDLSGASVLDLGCNAGFYSIEMKKRNAARVVGVDLDDRYLRQASFAAATLQLDIEFLKMSVYEADTIPGEFDYVLIMGVFYHLRYPLYALDRIIKKVRGRLIFQTMLRGCTEAKACAHDYHFWNKKVFSEPEFPRMYFIENSYAGDPTNWWIPNASAAEAMLRSSGLEIVAHPEEETWICEPRRTKRNGEYLLDLELTGKL